MARKSAATHFLPKLTNFSLKEGVRLTLIIVSSLSIALAGQMAQSRQEPLPESDKKVAVAVSTEKKAKSRAARETKLEKFAKHQVQSFQETLDALTERAELVALVNNASPADQARLQLALKDFDSSLMNARETLERIAEMEASSTDEDPFLEEDLRASLFALQESASYAQGELISLDTVQGFKVSRTGQ